MHPRKLRAAALAALTIPIGLGAWATPAGADPDPDALQVEAHLRCDGYHSPAPDWYVSFHYPIDAGTEIDLRVSVPGLPDDVFGMAASSGTTSHNLGPLTNGEPTTVTVYAEGVEVYSAAGTPTCAAPVPVPVPKASVTDGCVEEDGGGIVRLYLENEGTGTAQFVIDSTLTLPGDAPESTTVNRQVDGGDALTYKYGPYADGTELTLDVNALDDSSQDLAFETVVDCIAETTATTGPAPAPTTTNPVLPSSAAGAAGPGPEVLAVTATPSVATLPRTGSGTAALAAAGVLSVGVGLAGLAAARRRQSVVTR